MASRVLASGTRPGFLRIAAIVFSPMPMSTPETTVRRDSVDGFSSGSAANLARR